MKKLTKKEIDKLLSENPNLKATFDTYTNHTFMYKFEYNGIVCSVVCPIDTISIDKIYLTNKELVSDLLQLDEESYILSHL